VTRNCCIDMLRKRKKILFEEMDQAGVKQAAPATTAKLPG